MLALEVEFLPACESRRGQTVTKQAEWPPHPDRLFQALLAAWGRNESQWKTSASRSNGSKRSTRGRSWCRRLWVIRAKLPQSLSRQTMRARLARFWRQTAKIFERGRAGGTRAADKSAAARIFRHATGRSRPSVRYVWRQALAPAEHRNALARLARRR